MMAVITQAKQTLDDFVMTADVLREDKLGTVYAGKEKSTSRSVGVGKFERQKLELTDSQLEIYFNIQSSLSHRNILNIENHFYTKNSVYMIMDYSGQNLHKILQNPNCLFDERRAANCVVLIADALLHCHSRNVFHGELSTRNVLFGGGDIVKITFGWHVAALESPYTFNYSPPGRLEGYDFASILSLEKRNDSWALGVICYEMLVGKLPFLEKQIEDPVKLSFPSHMAEEAKDLIKKLLIIDPKKRLELPRVMTHKWIEKHITSGVKSRLEFFI